MLTMVIGFQALPIFLDSLVTAWGAILISVTLILLFGEVRILCYLPFISKRAIKVGIDNAWLNFLVQLMGYCWAFPPD